MQFSLWANAYNANRMFGTVNNESRTLTMIDVANASKHPGVTGLFIAWKVGYPCGMLTLVLILFPLSPLSDGVNRVSHPGSSGKETVTNG
jgi:hypothetical protein